MIIYIFESDMQLNNSLNTSYFELIKINSFRNLLVTNIGFNEVQYNHQIIKNISEKV